MALEPDVKPSDFKKLNIFHFWLSQTPHKTLFFFFANIKPNPKTIIPPS
jgi:hypothetical protein